MESYSSSLTLKILDKHRILRNVGRATAGKTTEDNMRACIIKMILSTDMVFHYELQANLASLVEITACRLHQRDMEATTDMLPIASDHHHHRLSASTDNSASSIATAEVTIPSPTAPSPSSSTKSNTCTDSSSEHFVTDIFRGDKSPLPHFEKRYSYFSDVDCGDVYPLMLDDPLLDQQERQMMCQIILHAADISNPLRPWPICCDWSTLVCQEFFRQGDEEKKRGLPVSPNMDRDCVTQMMVGMQFGDYIVGPYFGLFATLFPRADTLVQQLKKNRIEWQNMDEENLEKTTSTTSGKNADRMSKVSSAASSTTNFESTISCNSTCYIRRTWSSTTRYATRSQYSQSCRKACQCCSRHGGHSRQFGRKRGQITKSQTQITWSSKCERHRQNFEQNERVYQATSSFHTSQSFFEPSSSSPASRDLSSIITIYRRKE